MASELKMLINLFSFLQVAVSGQGHGAAPHAAAKAFDWKEAIQHTNEWITSCIQNNHDVLSEEFTSKTKRDDVSRGSFTIQYDCQISTFDQWIDINAIFLKINLQ